MKRGGKIGRGALVRAADDVVDRFSRGLDRRFTPTEVRNEDLSEPRAHVALAFDGAEWTSPYSVPLMVLQTLVGQWDG